MHSWIPLLVSDFWSRAFWFYGLRLWFLPQPACLYISCVWFLFVKKKKQQQNREWVQRHTGQGSDGDHHALNLLPWQDAAAEVGRCLWWHCWGVIRWIPPFAGADLWRRHVSSGGGGGGCIGRVWCVLWAVQAAQSVTITGMLESNPWREHLP